MRSRILSSAFLLAVVAGCTPIPHTRTAGDRRFVCIDGVEYLSPEAGPRAGEPTTPHLKPDGMPYSCNY
jgi:hypothetical protein